jgi:hypothetical protein
MNRQEIVDQMIGQLADEGFILDEEEKTYMLIDYRGTHKVVTYWIEGLWVTFTLTVEDDFGLHDVPFSFAATDNIR